LIVRREWNKDRYKSKKMRWIWGENGENWEGRCFSCLGEESFWVFHRRFRMRNGCKVWDLLEDKFQTNISLDCNFRIGIKVKMEFWGPESNLGSFKSKILTMVALFALPQIRPWAIVYLDHACIRPEDKLKNKPTSLLSILNSHVIPRQITNSS
jgi:hypothetical protein